MNLEYILWCSMCVNVVALFMWLRNDLVQQNNVKTYVGNETMARKTISRQKDMIDKQQLRIAGLETMVDTAVDNQLLKLNEETK